MTTLVFEIRKQDPTQRVPLRADAADKMSFVPRRKSFAHLVQMILSKGVDPAAPGGAITAALCGHWEHDGPCRWPHNSAIDIGREPVELRTVFTCMDVEELEVRALIDDALRSGDGWVVLSSHRSAIAPGDRELAARLLAGPHL